MPPPIKIRTPRPLGGIAFPFGKTQSGGIGKIADAADSPEQTEKIIKLTLQDTGNSNPFQSLPNIADSIFAILNDTGVVQARQVLTNALNTLQDRVEVKSMRVESHDDSHIHAEVGYVLRLSNTPQSAAVEITRVTST